MNASAVGFDAHDAMSRETIRRVAEKADGLQDRVGEERLEDIELKMSLTAGKGDNGAIADACAHTMRRASACVGLTLPGMVEEPGSFAGNRSSPKPVREPEPSNRISLAMLSRPEARLVSAPCVNAIASCAAIASNLLADDAKGSLASEATCRAKSSAKRPCALRPAPSAVTP